MRIENLKVNYDNKPILDIKHLELNTSSITALMGSNGSGKSTLLRIISYVEKPNSGFIYYKNNPKPSLQDLKEIAILFPEPTLLKRSVKENFLFAINNQGYLKNVSKRISESLELVGLDEGFLLKKHFQLSSGQTQRIAFAIILSKRAKLNILDEPTNSLDINTVKLFGHAIEYMQNQYKSGFIIASHDEKWLSAICKERTFMHDGKISKFEIINMFLVKKLNNNAYIDFENNKIIKLPSFLKNVQKIAINPSKIHLSIMPSKDFYKGSIHSVSIVYQNNLLIKIRFGSYLIKCMVSKNILESQILYPSQTIYFSIEDNAFLQA